MVRLAHDSGGPATVHVEQALGDDSPLEFDDDGYAQVDDEDAARLVAAMTRHIRIEPAAPPNTDADDSGDDTNEGEEFDAAAFVDRTPMDDVVADIESGNYDDHLDAIADAADRNGVQDAVSDRLEAEEE